MPRNKDTISMIKENWNAPAQIDFSGEALIPFRANEVVTWKMTD